MIVVDSSVLIDLFRATRTAEVRRLEQLVDEDDLILGDLVLYEVLRGARDETEALRLVEKLSGFVPVEMVGEQVVFRAALNYRLLRQRGITIRGMADLLIGTFCILNGHLLLHSDHDFQPMVEHLGLMEA